jgi:hypothetical protein
MNKTMQDHTVSATHLYSDNSTQSCMELCSQCHQTLRHTAMQYYLWSGGKSLDPSLFRLMLDCAEMCQTVANFQLSDSMFCREVSTLNAKICEACAKGCEQAGDMDDCVEACRQCAASCRGLNIMHA